MKHLKYFRESFEFNKEEKIAKIKNLKKLPKEYKEEVYKLIEYSTSAKNGKVTGLLLHPELKKKIDENGYPSGYSMGVDKDGYFIHTHRARGKSHLKPSGITAKEMKFIDSTG